MLIPPALMTRTSVPATAQLNVKDVTVPSEADKPEDMLPQLTQDPDEVSTWALTPFV